MTAAAILEQNDMTRVQIHFRLQKPLDDALLRRLSDTAALYGIQGIRLSPAMDSLMVEYDASRLRPEEVESALAGAGIAAKAV
jgi:allophanate hydrolase subunit 1